MAQDHGRKLERRGSHRDTKSDDEFDFGSAEEAEGRSAEESASGREGSNRKKEPKPAKHGGDEAIKGEKTKDELETANSDEREKRSEEADSVRVFGSETPNQLKAKRKKGQQKRRKYRDNTSRQAD